MEASGLTWINRLWETLQSRCCSQIDLLNSSERPNDVIFSSRLHIYDNWRIKGVISKESIVCSRGSLGLC